MNYTTNFSPKINNKMDLKNKKVFLKSFFILMFLLKRNPIFQNLTVFTKPIQFRKLVILRAPYRYKLARLHLTINRYNIVVSLKIQIQNNILNLLDSNVKKKVENFSSNLESLFLHQHKSTYFYTISVKNNFTLKNF